MALNFEIRPSESIWNYFKGEISVLTVVRSLADRYGGYHISYSANELLKDLKLLNKNDMPNKRGRELIALFLHEMEFGSIEKLRVIEPQTSRGGSDE